MKRTKKVTNVLKDLLKELLIISPSLLIISFLIFEICLFRGGLDLYTPEKAVIVDKFIWDTDEHETYTDGQTTIITGEPAEYNIELHDERGNIRYFNVTKDEYESLNVGDFLSVFDRHPPFTDSHYLVLYKGGSVINYDSRGKISSCLK